MQNKPMQPLNNIQILEAMLVLWNAYYMICQKAIDCGRTS